MNTNLLILIVVGFVLFDLFFLFVVVFIKKRRKFEEKDLQFIKMNWFRILDTFKANPQKSILDADKLLDFALGKRGKTGSLGEKLKQSNSFFSDINSVWNAHKLRNKIAHEFLELKNDEAQKALKSYKIALKDLGIDL